MEYLISGSTFGYRDGLTTEALLSENPSAMYFLSDRVLLIAEEHQFFTNIYYYEAKVCDTSWSYRDCQRFHQPAVESIIRIIDLDNNMVSTIYFDYGCPSVGSYHRYGCQDRYKINGRITSFLYLPSNRQIICSIDHSFERNVSMYIITENDGEHTIST